MAPASNIVRELLYLSRPYIQPTLGAAMRKNVQAGYLFLIAAFLFFVVSVVSERPGAYIALGAAFVVIGLATRKRNAGKTTGGEDEK